MNKANRKWLEWIWGNGSIESIDNSQVLSELLKSLKPDISQKSTSLQIQGILEWFPIKTLTKIDKIWEFNEYWIAIFQKEDKFGIVNDKGKIILEANNKKITKEDKFGFFVESTQRGRSPAFVVCKIFNPKWEQIGVFQKHRDDNLSKIIEELVKTQWEIKEVEGVSYNISWNQPLKKIFEE